MKAYELLSSPDKWTKSAYARDSFHNPVAFSNSAAQCWCINGAIRKCYGPSRAPIIEEIVQDVIRQNSIFSSTAHYNDDPATTYEDVIAILKKADV